MSDFAQFQKRAADKDCKLPARFWLPASDATELFAYYDPSRVPLAGVIFMKVCDEDAKP
jgi:hypothetical protein